MNLGIRYITANIGVSFEWTILIVLIVGGIIFYARDFRIGAIMHFVFFGLTALWFYSEGLNYTAALILTLIWLVILSLSLYAVEKSVTKGAVI